MINIQDGRLQIKGNSLEIKLEALEILRGLRKSIEERGGKELAEEEIKGICRAVLMTEEEYEKYVKRQLDIAKRFRELFEKDMDSMKREIEEDEEYKKEQEEAVRIAEEVLGLIAKARKNNDK